MSSELSAFLLIMAVKGWLWVIVLFLLWREEKRACKAAFEGWDSCIHDMNECCKFNRELHEANVRLTAQLQEEDQGDEWKRQL